MADMDLREVLADWLHENHCACDDYHRHLGRYEHEGETLARRLSQPDVLDEFERRAAKALDRAVPHLTDAATVRRVLSDMLGGGS